MLNDTSTTTNTGTVILRYDKSSDGRTDGLTVKRRTGRLTVKRERERLTDRLIEEEIEILSAQKENLVAGGTDYRAK